MRDEHEAEDPQLMAIVNYCSGEMDDEQSEAIDVRLATDTSFRTKAQPLIDAWFLATI